MNSQYNLLISIEIKFQTQRSLKQTANEIATPHSLGNIEFPTWTVHFSHFALQPLIKGRLPYRLLPLQHDQR